VFDYLRLKIDPLVQKNGWAIQAVGDENNAPYYYTIGLSAKRLPELILLLPIPFDLALLVLNGAAKTFVQTNDPQEGLLYNVIEKLPIKIRHIHVNAFREFGNAAVHWTAMHDYPLVSAMQVLFPDAEGRFPGDDSYNWVAQLVLPHRETLISVTEQKRLQDNYNKLSLNAKE
jgi:hypothetical protein